MKTQINKILAVILFSLFATMSVQAAMTTDIILIGQDITPYSDLELSNEPFIDLHQSLDYKYSTELAGSWVDLGNPF